MDGQDIANLVKKAKENGPAAALPARPNPLPDVYPEDPGAKK